MFLENIFTIYMLVEMFSKKKKKCSEHTSFKTSHDQNQPSLNKAVASFKANKDF